MCKRIYIYIKRDIYYYNLTLKSWFLHMYNKKKNMRLICVLTLGVATAALIIAIIGISRNQIMNSYYAYSSTSVDTLAAQSIPAPLVEYGGIDLGTPNPTHILEDSLHRNMDTRETIYPAAIFRGSLAMLSGNLILDDASDVLIAGMDVSLRGQILLQREMQAQICILNNASLPSCGPSTYLSSNCSCICSNPLYKFINNTCVLDCNNQNANSSVCNCTPPYTAYSGCYDISCPIGSYLNTSTCISFNTSSTQSFPPACANRSRASECLSRGNWFTDVVFYRDVVILNYNNSRWAFNCSLPFISDWNPAYCSYQPGYPLILTTFDQWQDEIVHNILLSPLYPPKFVDIWIETPLIGCITSSPNPKLGFRFVAAPIDFVDSDNPAFGSVYQIWSTDQLFCLLSRPLGADEVIMFGANCSGPVAIAANDPNLFTIPDSICGLFTVVDGDIQPFNSPIYIDWNTITFSNNANSTSLNVAFPVPINVNTILNTTSCRALNCFLEQPDSRCTSCIQAHLG